MLINKLYKGFSNMGDLQVLFYVPRIIQAGLASGQLERVGGVIVDSNTRQIVTWLRDSSIAETAFNGIMSSANPLNGILNAATTAVTLYDNHLTRQAINTLTASVNMLAQVTVGGHLLNLALTATTFHLIAKRIDKLSEQIDELGQKISEEFNRERDMRFKVALQAARDVFDAENIDLSKGAVRSAINGLYEARENFFKEFQSSLESAKIPEQLLLAQQYLMRAFYAETSRIQCYLKAGDIQLAITRLREDKHRFEEAVYELINHWKGTYPAIFFHSDVPSDNLDRFLNVETWLRTKSYRKDPRILFDIINDYRDNFWNIDILENNIMKHLTFKGSTISETRNKQLAHNLLQAEIMIENLERFYGFELEISEMRLSVEEWNHLIDEEELAEHGTSIIVDVEYMERLEHLSTPN